MILMPENTLFAFRTDEPDDALLSLSSGIWPLEEQAVIDRYWSGKSAISEQGISWSNLTRISSLWNQEAVFFCFECWFDELNVNPSWEPDGDQGGLWEWDVAEFFLAPAGREDYFEIEVSPLGQWLDIHVLQPRVHLDFDWESQLKAEVSLNSEEKIWTAIVKLPHAPLIGSQSRRSRVPRIGDAWRINFFRIAGKPPKREYLSWRPTFTQEADFHVPSSFGNLIFLPSDS